TVFRGSALIVSPLLLMISRSRFEANDAMESGGAFAFDARDTDLTIKDSQFVANGHIARSGGALSATAGHAVTIDGVRFIENTCRGIDDSEGGSALLLGSAEFDSVTVLNTLFLRNNAKKGEGTITI